jgi:hypothetical protein
MLKRHTGARHEATSALLVRFTVCLTLISVGACGAHASGADEASTHRAVDTRPALDDTTAQALGQRIWHNEGQGKEEYLMWWNAGEAFASLGIGHFIWYPAGRDGPYRESFPDLIRYLESRGVAAPNWLSTIMKEGCPWPNREAFFAARATTRFEDLQAFLRASVAEQARFIADRFARAEARVVLSFSIATRPPIKRRLDALQRSSNGMYALVDYVNFKGDGLHLSERYAGQGWGLAHVLERMESYQALPTPLQRFTAAARSVLADRVNNSPVERNEARWLPGWNARLNTYTGSPLKPN